MTFEKNFMSISSEISNFGQVILNHLLRKHNYPRNFLLGNNTSTHQHTNINISTYQHVNTSTRQHVNINININTATHRHIDTSTERRSSANATRRQCNTRRGSVEHTHSRTYNTQHTTHHMQSPHMWYVER